MTTRKKSYSGSITISPKNRHWRVYQGLGNEWLVSKFGGFGKVFRFLSKKEALKKVKELAETYDK